MTAAEREVSVGAALANAAVLVVDDEPGMRNFVSKALARRCALVESADSVDAAEQLRERYHFDLIVLDVRMPGRSGLDWLAELRDRDVRTDVIVMSAFADLDGAIAALRAGAADFLLKPFRLEQIVAAVGRCLGRRRAERENYVLRRQNTPQGVHGIVGESAAIRRVRDLVGRVAGTASTVLVQGETGTGKELVARAVHDASGREGLFVPVNCSAIPAALLESELFGHVRGAFTGAEAAREGLFSFAHGGTLFLDEIGEMPLAMQAKLLRVLDERVIRPVGADRLLPVDARVVAATNRRLAEEVAAGRFREDLFFRLAVLPIDVPPLRERREDIALLTRHFLRTLPAELGVTELVPDAADLERLAAYDWPGNVRELKNVLERSLLLGGFAIETPGAALPARAADEVAGDVPDRLAEVERLHILALLERESGNKTKAAERLGISRKTLDRKLRAWKATGEVPM